MSNEAATQANAGQGAQGAGASSPQEDQEDKAQEVIEIDPQVCLGCGRVYNYIWYAPNEMWNAVAGETSHLCIPCFDREAEAKGFDLIYAAHELGAERG